MKKKGIKSLIASLLAICVCFTTLIGTTFAWFTDSASSGSNVITAGNLDISVEYTLDGESWKDLDGATDLFQKGLWEPGHTEVVALKIENKGTLALKYTANMNIVKETVGMNKAGNEIVLSNILTVDTINMDTGVMGDILLGTAFSDETTLQYANTSSFKNANVLGSDELLLAGGAKYLIVKVDMAETVGIEANHNGVNIPEIEFGINVVATQFTIENDSFGNDYDKDAEYPVIDADGLSNAIAEGKDVKLEADINLNDTIIEVTNDVEINFNGFNLDASDNTSRPFEMGDGATLTINGNDETITCGAYGLVNIPEGNDATVVINGGKFVAETDAGSFIKPRGDGEINIVLNNVEYTDSSTNGRALDCTSYVGDDLNVVIEDCKFEATIGLILPEGATVMNTEITANNTKNMQPAIYATGDMTIENCIIKAEKSHAVAVAGGATLTVNDCEVYAGSDEGALAFQVFSSGGTINVNNTTYVGGYGTTGKMNTGRVAIINIDGVEVYRKQG